MNQAEVSKLMSQLRVTIFPRHRNFKNPKGPEGRLNKMRKTVTALIKYERIELFHNRAHEARGYAERLISDAIRYGDKNKEMMEMADFWLLEKQLVHKLFKVLVPRFQNFNTAVTSMYHAPRKYEHSKGKLNFDRSLLELKGHPFPAITLKDSLNNKNHIHNVLLDAAKKEFYKEKILLSSFNQDDTNISKPIDNVTNDDIIELNEKK